MATRGHKNRIEISGLFLSRLKEILDYNPDTGVFTWKCSRHNRVKIGSEAGYKHNGYICIEIDGRSLKAHRIAYAFQNGCMPVDMEIDHINGIKSDNRICNLRCSSISSNECNKALQKNNTSGVKGVYFREEPPNWRAIITKSGKRYHLGYFPSILEAERAISEFRDSLHGEFSNHGEFKK